MSILATVESLWRYPVKSMRGEQLQSAVIGSSGLQGDRVFAFYDTAAPADFPYFTARKREQMLLYRPFFRVTGALPRPQPGAAPVSDAFPETSAECLFDVELPDGRSLSLDDPAMLEELRAGLPERHQLSLMRSQRALTDCSPVSLFSLQTVQQLGDDLGVSLDKRRFRANIYLDFAGSGRGFAEDELVGRSIRVGETVVLAVLERDPRCKMITLDPDTAEANPNVMKHVARAYEGKAGVYASVLVEGTVKAGDAISIIA